MISLLEAKNKIGALRLAAGRQRDLLHQKADEQGPGYWGSEEMQMNQYYTGLIDAYDLSLKTLGEVVE